jgi:hypothetical protein
VRLVVLGKWSGKTPRVTHAAYRHSLTILVTIKNAGRIIDSPVQGGLMQRSSGPRKIVSNLSESVKQQLNMYAIAAGAGGVSLLALAQPSEAKIIYTHANVQLSPQKGVVKYKLDLNHDGITDFTLFDDVFSCSYGVWGGFVDETAAAGSKIYRTRTWVFSGSYPRAFPVTIGRAQRPRESQTNPGLMA